MSAVLLHVGWSGHLDFSYRLQLLAAMGLNTAIAVGVMTAIPRGSFLAGAGALQIGLAFVVSVLESSTFAPYSLYIGLGLAVWATKLRDPYFASAAMVALGAFAYNQLISVQPSESPAVSYSATAALALAFVLRRVAVGKIISAGS